MAEHAVHNGILIAMTFASMFLPPLAAAGVTAGFALANLIGSALAGRSLWAQRSDRREGRIARYELTPTAALVLAAALLFRALFLAPNMALTSLPFSIGLYFYHKLKS
ncbi:MAG: hypothetical protein HY922_14150 [Elusimicrobia bacterium]|nr:hypothetical protein [Elusimicrobiota bacterium]